MVTVHIDTTDRNLATVVLEKDGAEIAHMTCAAGRALSKELVPAIAALCSQHAITPKDITQVLVNPGPGAFTGTRTGVSVANALGFALGIPVNGDAAPIDVIYDKEPAITL